MKRIGSATGAGNINGSPARDGGRGLKHPLATLGLDKRNGSPARDGGRGLKHHPGSRPNTERPDRPPEMAGAD